MQTEALSSSSSIVMSAMRPTGRLHLGHYLGVLKNWVRLQELHTCYFHIADWHVLTTKAGDTEQLPTFVQEMALDWLAAGLNPEKATLFVQSQVPEIAELHLLLSMITPVKWLETDPTLKEMVAMLRGTKEAGSVLTPEEAATGELTYGLLGYPVLQTSDILTVQGHLVPVGKDQLAHLEISRDIARRFNHRVGEVIFPEPKPLLTEIPLLPGLDGRKMGKSYDNGVFLADTEEQTWQTIKGAVTDPARVKKSDPGDPKACTAVYPWYELFTAREVQAVVAEECRTAARGCMACKQQLADVVNDMLRPMRERRRALETDPVFVQQVLKEGTEKARAACSETLTLVRRALHLAS
jgi:tryptophanyl-tRNA synthetase